LKESENAITTLIIILVFIFIEWLGRNEKFALSNLEFKLNKTFRYLIYSIIIFLIGIFMPVKGTPFIYFQF